MCQGHHVQRKHGKPVTPLRDKIPQGTYKHCTIEGCTLPHRGKGLCDYHRVRQRNDRRGGAGLRKHLRFLHLRQRGICSICDNPLPRLPSKGQPFGLEEVVDHHFPVEHGGTDVFDNLRAVHKPCNGSKGDRIPIDAQFTLPLGAKGRHQKQPLLIDLSFHLRIAKTCEFPRCGKPHDSKGLCSGHWAQQRKGQALRQLRAVAPKGSVPAQCTLEGCDRPHSGRGLCKNHRDQEKRTEKLRDGTFTVCAFEDCGRPSSAKGLCVGHRKQQKEGKQLKPLRDVAAKGSVTAQCTLKGCDRPHGGKGLCENHREQQRRREKVKETFVPCRFQGCGRPQSGKGLCAGHLAQRRKGKELQPLQAIAAKGSVTGQCFLEGCDRPHSSKGLCKGHREKQRRQEQVREGTFIPCTFEGCGRPCWGKGLCPGHLAQQRKDKTLVPLRQNAIR